MFVRKVIHACLNTCRRMYSSTTPDRSTVNKALRVRLAAAYRGLDSYGLNEGIHNHLSAIAPASNSDGEIMLILPSHLHWNQATPCNLIEVNEKSEVVAGDGEPPKISLSAHQEIYRQRPDAKAVIHTHMTYTTTLACLKDPKLLMLHQNSTQFHNRIIFDTSYQGIGDTSKANLFKGGNSKRKDILVVRNHGVFVVAESIDLAFDDVYFLERATMIQVLAFSTHQELNIIEEAVAEKACKDSLKIAPDYAKRHLDCLVMSFGFCDQLPSK